MKKKGIQRKQVGLVLLGRGVLRDKQKVVFENGEGMISETKAMCGNVQTAPVFETRFNNRIFAS